MMGLGMLAPATLLACGTGVGWLALRSSGMSAARRILWAAALGPALGFAPPGLLVILFAASGRALPSATTLGVLLALEFGVLALVAHRLGSMARAPAPGSRQFEVAREPLHFTVAALLLLAAIALPAIDLVSAGLKSWPDGTWDAVAIWNARARLLFTDAGATASVLERLDEDAHPDYPLLVSASLAAAWKLLGHPSRPAAATQSLAWLVGILLLVGLSLSRPGRWAAGLLGVAAILALPPVLKWAPSQCADLAVAYALLLAAVAGGSSWARGGWPADRLPLGLAGWALGMLAATKAEGAALAGGVLIGWCMACLARRGRTLFRLAPELLAASPFVLALVAQRLALAPGPQRAVFLSGSWIERAVDPARWSEILSALWDRWSGGPAPHGWGPFWVIVLVLAALGLGRPRDRAARSPGAFALLAATATTVAAFLLTTFDLTEHLDTALDRLLAQIAPLALVLAAAPLVAPGEVVSLAAWRSVTLDAAGRLRALARRHYPFVLLGFLLILVVVKLLAIRRALGAMWRWPEELVVATTAFDIFHPVIRGAVDELSELNLTSAAIAPIDLLALEGADRYRALLGALNLALALLLGIAGAASRRTGGASIGWAICVTFALGGWMLLGDAIAGAAFLLYLVALERALSGSGSTGGWIAVLAAGSLCVTADSTLALPLLAAAGTTLLLGVLPTHLPARITSAIALAAPALLAGWAASRADSFARRAGAYLDFRLDAPLRLLEAEGSSALLPWASTLVRELGYLHVATLGWFFAGTLALLASTRRRDLGPAWQVLAGVLVAATLARAAWASAAMHLARNGAVPPRHVIYGRAMDFAIPAGLWLGGRALVQVRRSPGLRAAAIAALTAGGGAAFLLASLPPGYAEASLSHQVVPFQIALAPLVRLARLGSWPIWAFCIALALSVGLATVPLRGRGRAAARLVAAGIATALLAGTGLATLGEVAAESTGSLLHHSHAARAVRDAHNEGRLTAVAVDAEILLTTVPPVQEVLQWKDSLRVMADLPRLALSASPPSSACPAVLTSEPLPDRELVASFYSDRLFLWGPRSGPPCEFALPRDGS